MNPITILGAGAIGLLIHRQFHESGIQASILARSANTEQQLHFSELNDANVDTYSADWHHLPLETEQPHLQEIALLIVCVKAYQVMPALIPLLNKLNPSCHILLLHNGMGPHLALKQALKQRNMQDIGLSLGTTSQAALKLNSTHIKQTGTGLTQLGHFFGPRLNSELQQSLLKVIPNSQWLDDIIVALWQKLAINAAINPLTAIHNCNNGQLAHADYQQDIEDIVSELHQVAHAEGITLDKQALVKRVYSVIELTQANYSSMYQDVKHGRQTEIAAINGYVCERSQQYGVATPSNKQMLNAILAMEHKS